MEIWYIVIICCFVSFGFGVWAGVAMLYKTWLEPGIDKGILDFGGITYKLSRIVKRNTRI